MNKKQLYYLVLLLPVILMAFTAIYLNDARGPYWLAYNSDPDYAYLMTSLSLAELKNPKYHDHPGTTVQSIGAVTLRFVHFISQAEEDLQTDVIKYPEYYLSAMNKVFIMLNTLLVFAIGIVALRYTGNVGLSLLLQFSPFFSLTILSHGLTRVEPEPLLLVASLLFVLAIPIMAERGLRKNSWSYVIFFAVVSGFGIATKFSFLPMIIFPLIVLPSFRNKVIYIFGTVGSFILFILPIWPEYKLLFNWFMEIVTHTGKYGSGGTGFINSDEFILNIGHLLRDNMPFSIVLSIAICLISASLAIPRLRRIAKEDAGFRLLFAAISTQVLSVLVVAKHPGNRYLIPALSFSGATLFLALDHFKKIKSIISVTIKRFAYILVILVVSYSCYGTTTRIMSLHLILDQKQMEGIALQRKLNDEYKDYGKVYYYRSSSPFYALLFGNAWADFRYTQALARIYGNAYNYNIWERNYYIWGSPYYKVPFDYIKSLSEGKVVFQGTRFEGNREKRKPDLRLKEVYSGTWETIYLVE